MYHRVPPELLVNPSAIVVLQIIDSSRIDPVNFTLGDLHQHQILLNITQNCRGKALKVTIEHSTPIPTL